MVVNEKSRDFSSCVGELDAYLADCNANNCMQFWQENVNKFPNLYQLHMPSETSLHLCYISSHGEMFQCIVNARQSRLTDQMLDWRYAG